MIAVALTDGLANRMFQYAFGQGLKAKGFQVLYDRCHYKPKIDQTWEFVDLKDAFPNIDIEYTNKSNFYFTFPGHLKGSRYWQRIFEFLNLEIVYLEQSFAFVPKIEDQIKRNTLFYGHWQTEKYFEICKDAIKNNFIFLPFSEDLNIVYSRKMREEESVAIHVRKGSDYHRWKSTHGICDIDYYKASIKFIKSRITNPVFYVFTDNPNWVNENFTGIDYTLVDWNPIKGKYNFRDMQLMSCAKHNIIANSTYSWWGAWLNKNPCKLVVAPNRWVNGVEPRLIDINVNIVPNGWYAM